MGDFVHALLTIGGGIGALILVYLLFSHPDAVVAEVHVASQLVQGETKILQGR